jgi:uncharacterized membrane protein
MADTLHGTTTATARGTSSPESGPWLVILLITLSFPVALYGLAFSFLPDANPDFHQRLMTLPWYAYAHFLGSATALLVGGFQFSVRLRRAWPQLHRWVGRTYLTAVLVGGVGGLGLATISHGGPSTHVAFALLAVLWLHSGGQAYRAIRGGNVPEHRRWMIRSFALTFAAVTLRIQLGLFTGVFGWTFDDAYLTVAWSSWVPNLVVAEWWLLRSGVGNADSHSRRRDRNAAAVPD